jgi:hypothetical protein
LARTLLRECIREISRNICAGNPCDEAFAQSCAYGQVVGVSGFMICLSESEAIEISPSCGLF